MLNGNNNIVWLASYPKSGNTWFRILMANLMSNINEPININELDRSIISSSRPLFDKTLGIDSSDLNRDEIQTLRPEMYRMISQKNDELIYIKVHDAWGKTMTNDPIFPNDVTKGVIYLIRHPLDVAVSFAYHRNISYEQSLVDLDNPENSFCSNGEKLYSQLPQMLSTWSGHVESWIDDSHLPIHIIKYESMLIDTFKEFSGALDFLGLKYSTAQIEKAIEYSDFELLKKQEQKFDFREKPIEHMNFFRSGTSYNWKNYYNAKQVEIFKQRNESLLQRFNYSLIDS